MPYVNAKFFPGIPSSWCCAEGHGELLQLNSPELARLQDHLGRAVLQKVDDWNPETIDFLMPTKIIRYRLQYTLLVERRSCLPSKDHTLISAPYTRRTAHANVSLGTEQNLTCFVVLAILRFSRLFQFSIVQSVCKSTFVLWPRHVPHNRNEAHDLDLLQNAMSIFHLGTGLAGRQLNVAVDVDGAERCAFCVMLGKRSRICVQPCVRYSVLI